MELHTERLIIRPFVLNDFEDLFPLDQDPRVMKYLGECKPKPIDKEAAMKRLIYTLNYYDQHPGFGVFATCIKDSGVLIGWTALKDLDRTELIEIGYRYFFDHWNKGYATEAATALRDHGFNTLNLEIINAVTHPENAASKHILEKLGFRFIRKDNFYNADVDFYEMRNPDEQG